MTTRPSWRTLLSALLLPTVLFLALLYAATQFSPTANPHEHFKQAQQCPKCHVYYRSQLEPTRFVTDADTLCLGCHTSEQLGRSHPRNVNPKDKYWKMKVPADFILDDDGRLICLTCHTAHGSFLSTTKSFAAQKPENPGSSPLYYRTYYSRRSDPVKGFALLCDGCHNRL